MPRPEFQAPPDVFYNESEARKYTTSSRIIEIQVSKRSASPPFNLSFADFAVLMPSDMPSFSLGFPRGRWSCSLSPTMASPRCFST
jgi:hypothetical protein